MSDKTEKILQFIASTNDTEKLRALMQRAREMRAKEVEDAAFRKLVFLVPSELPGSAEHHLWQTIIAFEEILTLERGRTTRLSRTRQKIARVGEIQTLIDWALDDKKTQGFDMLMERGMPELTGEAIILNHSERFSEVVLNAARVRLIAAGVDIAMMQKSGV